MTELNVERARERERENRERTGLQLVSYLIIFCC